MMYWTYTRRWFSDSLNFPPRSLRQKLLGVDVEARTHFPALKSADVFCDGPAGSQVPQQVVDAVSNHLLNNNANVGGAYRTSEAALRTVTAAREAASALLGVDPKGVVFGQNFTSICMHLSRSVAKTLQPGDNVVVSAACHDANVAPWLLAARDAGAEVRTLPADEIGQIQLPAGMIDSKTKVVAVGLASNALGTIQELEHILEAARGVGAISVLDGTHFVPHQRVSLEKLGADVLICSGYKFFGPHMGVMAARPELLEKLQPYKSGWRSESSDRLPAGLPTPEDCEISKWEMGTLGLEQLAGFNAAVRYLASLALSKEGSLSDQLDKAFLRIQTHEEALSVRFLEGMAELRHSLKDASSLELHGTWSPSRRTPTFAMYAPALGDKLCNGLVQRGIFCSHGNHYAPALVEDVAGRPDGVTRVGFMHYSTEAEVDRVLAAIKELVA